MIKVTPFRRWHLLWLMDEPAVGGALPFDIEVAMTLEKHNSWTASDDGAPIACGGTIEQWKGRHQAWMFMTTRTAPHMLTITRAVKRQLAATPGRVEMTVRADFPQGHRWARMLGFQREFPGVLKQYGPEGEDHVGYVRLGAR
jgi:hypothetical protein